MYLFRSASHLYRRGSAYPVTKRKEKKTLSHFLFSPSDKIHVNKTETLGEFVTDKLRGYASERIGDDGGGYAVTDKLDIIWESNNNVHGRRMEGSELIGRQDIFLV